MMRELVLLVVVLGAAAHPLKIIYHDAISTLDPEPSTDIAPAKAPAGPRPPMFHGEEPIHLEKLSPPAAASPSKATTALEAQSQKPYYYKQAGYVIGNGIQARVAHDISSSDIIAEMNTAKNPAPQLAAPVEIQAKAAEPEPAQAKPDEAPASTKQIEVKPVDSEPLAVKEGIATATVESSSTTEATATDAAAPAVTTAAITATASAEATNSTVPPPLISDPMAIVASNDTAAPHDAPAPRNDTADDQKPWTANPVTPSEPQKSEPQSTADAIKSSPDTPKVEVPPKILNAVSPPATEATPVVMGVIEIVKTDPTAVEVAPPPPFTTETQKMQAVDNKPIDLAGADTLELKNPTDVEVSNINGRIFDDAGEKNVFKQKQHEMNLIVAPSVNYETRVKECHGKCGEGLKLFTVWTTPADGWNNKYTRSVDSALFHHPKAEVTIYSSSLPPTFLDNFKKLGFNAKVERLNFAERAKDTPMESWAQNLEKWHDGPYYYAHLSDAVRLVQLYKEGGVYFDTDVVFVNQMGEVRNAIGWERSDSLCNALMAFEPRNEFLKETLTQFNNNYNINEWAANGPFLLTKVYHEKFEHSNEVHAYDKAAFYLISWVEVQKFFDKESEKDIDHDLAILKQKAFVVHFWNSRSHDLVVHPQSLMARMFTSFCVYCNAIAPDASGLKLATD